MFYNILCVVKSMENGKRRLEKGKWVMSMGRG